MKINHSLLFIMNLGKCINSYALRTTMAMKGTEQRRLNLQNKLYQNLLTKITSNQATTNNPVILKFNSGLSLENYRYSTTRESFLRNNRIPVMKKISYLAMKNGHDYEYNSQDDWNKKGRKSISKPVISLDPIKLAPILIENKRILNCYVFNRYSGKPIRCKLCNETIHNYLSHLHKCEKVTETRKDYFSPIQLLKTTQWTDIAPSPKTKILILLVELKLLLSPVLR
jgi:hypothetical protein